MDCTKCGAKIEAGALFCANCGMKVQPLKKFCPKCGTQLSSDAEFCSGCGARAVSEKYISVYENLNRAQKRKNVVAIAICIVGLFLIFMWWRAERNKLAEEYSTGKTTTEILNER